MTCADWFKRLRFPIVLLLFLMGLFLLRTIAWPFVVAFILSILLEPAVQWVERRGARRSSAVLTVFFVLLLMIGAALLWIMPRIIMDLNRALNQVPAYARELQMQGERTMRFFHRLPPNIQEYVNLMTLRAGEIFRQILVRFGAMVIAVFSRSFLLLLIPILAYYISRDMPGWRRRMHRFVPRWLGRDAIVFWRTITVVGAYMRGQILNSLVVGGLLSIGLILLGVEFGLLIGTLGGLLNLIPYFGPVFGAIPAVALAGMDSPWKALYVVVLFFAVNQLEAIAIMPRLVGRRVGLHPVVVIFLLLLGGQYLGFFGMLLAVPTGAVVKVILEYYWPMR